MTLLEKIDRGTLRTSSLALVPDNKSPRTANKLYWGYNYGSCKHRLSDLKRNRRPTMCIFIEVFEISLCIATQTRPVSCRDCWGLYSNILVGITGICSLAIPLENVSWLDTIRRNQQYWSIKAKSLRSMLAITDMAVHCDRRTPTRTRDSQGDYLCQNIRDFFGSRKNDRVLLWRKPLAPLFLFWQQKSSSVITRFTARGQGLIRLTLAA